MKIMETIAVGVSFYLALHLLLAADAVPKPLLPVAKALENEDLTKVSGVILDGLLGAV